ncbi:ParB/RepB/Spo0J family partition protein [Enterobacter roggenkampii]|uniref:ParB/RepB/Spo0J family partition protein n=1 Tax=Enterobacter roggenkampii TaxID=1812935 RepID=UPI000A4C10CC|nr:ParB/RepB/Spo0J family partition protein [Enterobacter roggenkampii]MDL0060079.1 ParB N-terminal domain-containing protein [Enterobacter roggenkampii]
MAATNTTAKKPAKSTSAKKTAEKIAQTTEQKLVQLLADTPVQIFPYSRLSHTGLNTRIIPHTDQEVEEMADSIQAMGILQNLIGAELPDGTIGIVGGEGRRRGTGILVMRGVLDADTPFVPVKVLPVEMAVAASMIENGRRKNMHPAEQIIGFRTLQQEGKTASQIGALMGYHPRHVQRCLKLANLAPSLLDALARDEISLEQCEVLTLADTHERQEQVWKRLLNSGAILPYRPCAKW